MNDMDLGEKNLRKHIDLFYRLERKPSFSICDDVNLQFMFFNRKDKYISIRTGEKSDFVSPSAFIVNSFLVEEIQAHHKKKLSLENLTVAECSEGDLVELFSRAEKSKVQLPGIADIERCCAIVNSSDIYWNFLEEKKRYHSIFWNESESGLFKRSA